MKKNSTLVLVVAVSLMGPNGQVLMQRRRMEAMHGGLWEFPGGKVKPGETAEQAIIREIEEELAISLAPQDLAPLAFASDPRQPPGPRDPHVILLYTAQTWHGEPRCLAGEEIAWFAPDELAGLAMPPLDVALAEALLRTI